MASVTLEKVSKFYGNVEAVKKINLEIKDNEFLVLVGAFKKNLPSYPEKPENGARYLFS